MGYIAIPKALFGPTYGAVSAEAKLLYGHLSDRSSLSKSNGDAWKTPSGEVFVYFPIAEICKTLGCGHEKATRLLRELADAGLIRRIRQGLGKPDKIIVTTAFQNPEGKHSKPQKSREQECDAPVANKTNLYIPDSKQPDQPFLHSKKVTEVIIKANICYDILISEIEKSFVDCAVSVIVDALCNPAPSMQIAGARSEKDEICRRLMHVNDMHVRYAFDRTKSMTQEIRSPRAYILARLYLAEEEMDIYYNARVAADERRMLEVTP